MGVTEIFIRDPLTGFTLDSTYGYLATIVNPSFSLISGRTYTVVWDNPDAPYTVTAFDMTVPGLGTFVVIGNGSILGYPGNNEPFAIAVNSELAHFLAFTDSASSHAVCIGLNDIEVEGPGIILLDHSAEPTNHGFPERLRVDTTEGGTTEYVHEVLVPEVEAVTVEPDFSGGDMVVVPGEGKAFGAVTIPAPDTLIPENIAEGVNIAGIVGALAAGGGAVIKWGQLPKNSSTTKTIEHGLGVVPDFFAFFATTTTLNSGLFGAGYGFSEAAAALAKTAAYYRVFGIVSGGSAPSNTYITDSNTFAAVSNATDTTININECGNTLYYWIAIGGITG